MEQIPNEEPRAPEAQAADQAEHPEQQQAEVVVAAGEGTKKKANRDGPGRSLLRFVIGLLVIVVGLYVILFVVAKATRFDSIGSMLQHMFIEVSLMWQRITS